MAKDDTSKASETVTEPGQGFGSTGRSDAPDTAPSVTHHVTSPVTPPESRVATSGAKASQASGEQEQDSNKGQNQEQGTGDVELYMAYPQDQFKYGDGDDDVLTGKRTKKFSRDEADRILGLARMSNLQVLEHKPEDAS